MKPNLENPPKGLQSGSPTPTAEPTVSDGGASSPGFDDMFTITCGKCKATSPLLKWCDNQPDTYFTCPVCEYRFYRRLKLDAKPWERFYELVQIK